jgi:hypothetical protein
LHYVILRPQRTTAFRRAVRREGPADLTDPHPVAAMYSAFEDLGVFEANVVDTSDLSVEATLQALQAGMTRGQFRLAGQHRSDMERLATKFGVPAPSTVQPRTGRR